MEEKLTCDERTPLHLSSSCACLTEEGVGVWEGEEALPPLVSSLEEVEVSSVPP